MENTKQNMKRGLVIYGMLIAVFLIMILFVNGCGEQIPQTKENFKCFSPKFIDDGSEINQINPGIGTGFNLDQADLSIEARTFTKPLKVEFSYSEEPNYSSNLISLSKPYKFALSEQDNFNDFVYLSLPYENETNTNYVGVYCYGEDLEWHYITTILNTPEKVAQVRIKSTGIFKIFQSNENLSRFQKIILLKPKLTKQQFTEEPAIEFKWKDSEEGNWIYTISVSKDFNFTSPISWASKKTESIVSIDDLGDYSSIKGKSLFWKVTRAFPPYANPYEPQENNESSKIEEFIV